MLCEYCRAAIAELPLLHRCPREWARIRISASRRNCTASLARRRLYRAVPVCSLKACRHRESMCLVRKFDTFFARASWLQYDANHASHWGTVSCPAKKSAGRVVVLFTTEVYRDHTTNTLCARNLVSMESRRRIIELRHSATLLRKTCHESQHPRIRLRLSHLLHLHSTLQRCAACRRTRLPHSASHSTNLASLRLSASFLRTDERMRCMRRLMNRSILADGGSSSSNTTVDRARGSMDGARDGDCSRSAVSVCRGDWFEVGGELSGPCCVALRKASLRSEIRRSIASSSWRCSSSSSMPWSVTRHPERRSRTSSRRVFDGEKQRKGLFPFPRGDCSGEGALRGASRVSLKSRRKVSMLFPRRGGGGVAGGLGERSVRGGRLARRADALCAPLPHRRRGARPPHQVRLQPRDREEVGILRLVGQELVVLPHTPQPHAGLSMRGEWHGMAQRLDICNDGPGDHHSRWGEDATPAAREGLDHRTTARPLWWRVGRGRVGRGRPWEGCPR
eukprot:Sspe_Gene.95803::Locus_68107_Transcript_1_1_Confidence_1.000_Length_3733::g.95803::m.95803